MFKSIDLKEKHFDFEKRVKEYWQENNIAKLSMNFREDAPDFVFYEGPPTANGKPGIHHVISRAIKDTVCRYKTMKGYRVDRKAGWDTHGLPVEIEVEKKLGLHDKNSIEEYGVEKFCRECKESVFSYEKEWRQMTEMMGYWIDLDNPYITLENDYIETVWWILNKFFCKNLIYKGHKIVPYCPSCETPLSSHEVALGYKEVEDPSVFIKFKVKSEYSLQKWDLSEVSFLAWTTTPWTLISNVALAVSPDDKYVLIEHNNEYLVLAEGCLNVIDGEYRIVTSFNGEELSGVEYEQLFPFISPDKKAFYVVTADYVVIGDGTGVVHTAPAFGQDDYNTGRKYDLPILQPVNGEGKFTAEITDWSGMPVKEADKGIIRKLKEMGSLYKRTQILHNYPFCWRCSSALIYFARSSWYIRTSEYKDALIEENRKINWYPSFVGEKRFGEWLENNVDWAISRDRFWGTPLNIWVCPDCDTKSSIGSISELREKGRLKTDKGYLDIPEDIELHKPYIDRVVLECPHCKKEMARTPEVIDCWFDSGSMPFAQWHYPFEREEEFDEKLFPADFISEGIDQTRGWFYTMLAISVMLKGKSSYKSVLVNDLILDKKGQKMSKSRGNSVDPAQLMQKYGADAIRWYLLAVSPPWVPTKFDTKGVEEVSSKLLGTLKNVYSFFATYANIDEWKVEGDDYNADYFKYVSHELDRWVISRFQSIVTEVVYYTDRYELTKAVRVLQSFILDELSNWYVRRARRRYWALEMTKDKEDAYKTLCYILVGVSKLIAPYTPFIAESIYRNITDGQSVHLTDYPEPIPSQIDKPLEYRMQKVIEVVSLGRTARNNCQIKVRQTLQAIYVPEKYRHELAGMEDLIKEELNIREVKYIDDKSDLVLYEIKPDFRVMGPKFGKMMKSIAKELQKADTERLVETLDAGGSYELQVDGKVMSLVNEDLNIAFKSKEGFAFEASKDVFVALDVNLTEELILEGYAREIVNKVQFSRKEAGFEFMDKIKIFYSSDNVIDEVIEKFGQYIKEETLAQDIINKDPKNLTKWDINDKEVYLRLEKIDV